MMTGGMMRMGAGRTMRVTAVSMRAFLAATFDDPTTFLFSSNTLIPSDSSLLRISTTLQVLAVAGSTKIVCNTTRFIYSRPRVDLDCHCRCVIPVGVNTVYNTMQTRFPGMCTNRLSFHANMSLFLRTTLLRHCSV